MPTDAVTASGSGLDPEISPAYAQIQEKLRREDPRHHRRPGRRACFASTQKGRDLGFMGESSVNVLELNLALDRSTPIRPDRGSGGLEADPMPGRRTG